MVEEAFLGQNMIDRNLVVKEGKTNFYDNHDSIDLAIYQPMYKNGPDPFISFAQVGAES